MATDYSNYDSSDYATLPESVAHSKDNPLLINNLSDTLIYAFNGMEVLIQEPKCALKELLFFFEDLTITTTIPDSELYRPELTARRIYKSADLWYTLLLINNMSTVMEYNRPTIKYIPPDKLSHIETFVRMHKGVTRVVVENDLSDYDI